MKVKRYLIVNSAGLWIVFVVVAHDIIIIII